MKTGVVKYILENLLRLNIVGKNVRESYYLGRSWMPIGPTRPLTSLKMGRLVASQIGLRANRAKSKARSGSAHSHPWSPTINWSTLQRRCTMESSTTSTMHAPCDNRPPNHRACEESCDEIPIVGLAYVTLAASGATRRGKEGGGGIGTT